MLVKKRNGTIETFSADKINRVVQLACNDFNNVSVSDVVLSAKLNLYDGVTTKEIDKALIFAARSKIEEEPNYSYVAARLLLRTIYKEVFQNSIKDEDLNIEYKLAFKRNIATQVKHGYFDKRLLKFDLDYLSSKLDISRDLKFKYLGLQTVYDRYLTRYEGRRVETPQAFLMRVAMGLSLNEKNKEFWAIKFYNAISNFYFMPSTPTLFNSGTSKPQLSSCFLSTMEDSLHGIMGEMHSQASLSKHAGGVSLDVTNVRAKNSEIKSNGGKAAGVIPYCKIFNDTLLGFDQASRRRGAGVVWLEVWHLDVFDFLQLRKNTGDDRLRTHDTHIAVWVPNLFMKRVEENVDWYLFSPDEFPQLHDTYGEEFEKYYLIACKLADEGKVKNYRKILAKDLAREIYTQQFETGYPFVGYKDVCNARYPLNSIGTINNSNLCTEIIEHNIPSKYNSDGDKVEIGETAVCTINSHNLSELSYDDGEIQWDLLEDTIYLQVRALDNAIDLNYYPTKEAQKGSLTHRYIGLGSMGLLNVLYKANIPYESAREFISKLAEFTAYHTISASCMLAEERGTFSTYNYSLWDRGIFPQDSFNIYAELMGSEDRAYETMNWDSLRDRVEKYGVRNATLMATAPTATISYICGCFPSINPDYSVLYAYETLSGVFTMVNEYFIEDMKQLNLWSKKLLDAVKTVNGDLSLIDGIPQEMKDKYKTVFNLDYYKIIDCNAERQKWIDQAVSFDFYINKPSKKYISELNMYAWKKLLKTTYYTRSQSASTIEKSTVEKTCSLDCQSCQ